MANEIERKFLINLEDLELQELLKKTSPHFIKQSYLNLDKEIFFQVQIFAKKEESFLLLEGPLYCYEKEIPFQDAKEILSMCDGVNYYTNQDQIFRIRQKNEIGFITLKGKKIGITQPEYEYEIPKEEITKIFKFCEKFVEKNRFDIIVNDKKWEIDFFLGNNEGLVVAEIELEHENEDVKIPNWIMQEVTQDKKFSNAQLFIYPFSQWTDEEKNLMNNNNLKNIKHQKSSKHKPT